MPKTEFKAGEENLLVVGAKPADRSNKRRTEMLSLSRAERISFTTRNKAVSVQVLLNRLIERGCYGFLRDGREVCGERLF